MHRRATPGHTRSLDIPPPSDWGDGYDLIEEVDGAALPILGYLRYRGSQRERASRQQILSAINASEYQVVGKLNVLERLRMVRAEGDAFELAATVPVLGTVNS